MPVRNALLKYAPNFQEPIPDIRQSQNFLFFLALSFLRSLNNDHKGVCRSGTPLSQKVQWLHRLRRLATAPILLLGYHLNIICCYTELVIIFAIDLCARVYGNHFRPCRYINLLRHFKSDLLQKVCNL